MPILKFSLPVVRHPHSLSTIALLSPVRVMTVLCFVGIALCSSLASAGSTTPTAPDRGQLLETVKPTEFKGDLRNTPRSPTKSNTGAPKEINPRIYHNRPPSAPPVKPTAPDPLLKKNISSTNNKAVSDLSAPLTNFAGQGFSGYSPPDTNGDVGPNHYIQTINGPNGGGSFVIYDKTGATVVSQTDLSTLGATGDCLTGGGDPIVLYDTLADRWFMSEFASDVNGATIVCIYVSKTSDPVAGGWWAYQFDTPDFPDFPKYAVWPDAYYLSTNESSPAAYALERSKMLLGQAASAQRFTATALPTFGFQALTPADLDGSTAPPVGAPGYFVRQVDDELLYGANTPNDYLEVWGFHVDWATPANSTFSNLYNITVADFDSDLCGIDFVGCVAQPGTNVVLDPLREVVMWRVAYRNFNGNEKLAGNFSVDVNNTDLAGIRWFELNKTSITNWSLAQEGTHSLDTNSRWLGSIAMDGCGDIALGYSVSSSTVYPGISYAGRLSSDPAGTLAQGENSIVGGAGSQTAGFRWGDYSSMSIDPVDDATFWYTNEYVQANGLWATQVASFKFNSCKSNQIISFTPPPTQTFSENATFNVSATSTSGLPVAFSSKTQDVCTVQNSTVSMVSLGTCTIAANQVGNSNFNAATEVTGNVILAKLCDVNVDGKVDRTDTSIIHDVWRKMSIGIDIRDPARDGVIDNRDELLCKREL